MELRLAFSSVQGASSYVVAYLCAEQCLICTKTNVLWKCKTTETFQLMSSLLIILMLLVASFLALGRTLAKANLYMFISAAAYLDLSGVLGYYYTAGEGCVPDGRRSRSHSCAKWARVVGCKIRKWPLWSRNY